MGGNVAMIMRDMTENYKKSTFLCAEALIKKPMRIYSASAFYCSSDVFASIVVFYYFS